MSIVEQQPRWGDLPGRELQVQHLSTLLSRRVCQNVVIHGAASTGKTSVLRHVLRRMAGVRQAFITCCSSLQATHLLADVLSQLRGSKRRRADGYAITCCKNGAETMTHFLHELPGACGGVRGERAIIVLDNAHTLAGQLVLAGLLTARERTGVNVSVVLVTRMPVERGEFDLLAELPAAATAYRLHFPQYTKEETLALLMKSAPLQLTDGPADVNGSTPSAAGGAAPASALCGSRQMYYSFLDFCVYNAFAMYARDIVELRQLARRLWPLFIAPQRTGATKSLQELMSAARSFLPAEIRAFVPGVLATTREEQQCHAAKSAQLDLPEEAKLMLVAGYLCSHNTPTLDKQVFDVQARSRRVGKKSGQNADRQIEDAREAQLAGPHNFNVARLLAIYSRLQQHRAFQAPIDINTGRPVGAPPPADSAAAGNPRSSASLPAGTGVGPPGAPSADHALQAAHDECVAGNVVVKLLRLESADVLMQVPKLAAMRLFVQAGTDDLLDGGVKYVCAIPQDLARQLARELGMELQSFLRYA